MKAIKIYLFAVLVVSIVSIVHAQQSEFQGIWIGERSGLVDRSVFRLEITENGWQGFYNNQIEAAGTVRFLVGRAELLLADGYVARNLRLLEPGLIEWVGYYRFRRVESDTNYQVNPQSNTQDTSTGQKKFWSADFIVPRVETVRAYADELARWTDHNFRLWSQMGSQTDEDTIIAWCGEAVRRGVYRSAVQTVPLNFSPSPQRTWESAVYQFDRRIGVWQGAVRGAASSEREKVAAISRLLGDQNNGIFIEKHLIEFLAIRNYEQQINTFLSFVGNLDSSMITLDMCPGILESYLDMNRWRPRTNNPFAGFIEQVCQMIADNLHNAGQGVFVIADDYVDTAFNLRLGMAINEWGEQSGSNDWAGLGRLLIFSVLSLGRDNGSIPASLTLRDDGEFIPSAQRISSAKLYRLLGCSEYLPHATATDGNSIWAWTSASAININQSDRQVDISVSFPVGETHYIMLRNIQSSPTLQIHGTNWSTESDFESYYDASGWYYFEDEQILVVKINHRSTVENIRIFYATPRFEPLSVQPEE